MSSSSLRIPTSSGRLVVLIKSNSSCDFLLVDSFAEIGGMYFAYLCPPLVRRTIAYRAFHDRLPIAILTNALIYALNNVLENGFNLKP